MERNASIMDTTHPDLLLQPPHYVGELIRFIIGEWQPDSSQQEQLAAHLTTCSSCRIALIELLLGEQEYEKRLISHLEARIENLLMRFITIHHELEARDIEQIAAYAETVNTEKKEAADKRFPRLAEHLKRCVACRAMLEEMLAFLKEGDQTD